MMFEKLKQFFTIKKLIGIEYAMTTAMAITSEFEGSGFANIVGNFDGQGLTCGALGWIWKTGAQQRLVCQFDVLYPGLIEKYMPTRGHLYTILCYRQVCDSLDLVVHMTENNHVIEPYLSELRQLWGSEEMIRVQNDAAQGFATQAVADASAWAKAGSNSSDYTVQEFCFFFDIAVNNGSLLHLSYTDVKNSLSQSNFVNEIFKWCDRSENRDCRFNANYWRNRAMTDNERELFVMAYLRSLKSKPEWQGSVMNRKGLIAFGSGFNQGVKKDFYAKYPGFTDSV